MCIWAVLAASISLRALPAFAGKLLMTGTSMSERGVGDRHGDRVLIGNAGAYTTCYSGRSTFNGYPAPTAEIVKTAIRPAATRTCAITADLPAAMAPAVPGP
jgi:hypothetical protein